ncbi:MAG: conjugal transfer protein TraG N-terminal domain-containing protein [Lentimicrobium sp.]|nr:conjugal transfer protein TraG N-terminal domain-containing protein [Lentimicrobium sp.]
MKRLFILLLLFLTDNLFAIGQVENFTFIVDNPTMVDAYFNIFNSMAALFQSADYLQLLKLVFLLGGFGVFFSGVLKSFQGSSGVGAISDFGKYMILGTTLLTLIFHDKSNLIIKTNNLGTFCQNNASNITMVAPDVTTGTVVGNIPTALAWGFSFLNEIGVETTKMARTAFSPLTTTVVLDPSARQGFASYLAGIGAVTSISLDNITSDSTLATGNAATIGSSLVSITNDCILIPAGQDPNYGEMVINAMKQTGDVRRTMNDLIKSQNIVVYKNPTDINSTSIATGITFGGIIPANLFVTISGDLQTCGQAWDNLQSRLTSLSKSGVIECSSSLKDVFDPVAITVLTGQSGLATVSNAQNIALQCAMANQMFDSKRNLAIGSDASFAAGKSMSEFTTNSLGSGYYMAQMLPYLQMGMRAVLYAFFPFVFVVILLPGGLKVLVSYLQSLLWIELWTPTAAILDMFLGLISTNKFSSMYNNKGFNPTNGMQSFSDAAMLASVGGYLYASVPALTYLILKGSAQMLGNISSGMASGFSKNFDSGVINTDVGHMKKLNEINKDRTSKGSKMISLAEMDSLEAGHNSRLGAGNWMTNEENKDKLVDTGKGKMLQKIMSGTAVQHIYGENSDAQKSYLINEQQKQIDIQEKQIAVGTQDGDTKVMHSIAKTMGQEENQKIMDAAYKQEALGTNTNDPKRVAAVAAVRAVTAQAAFSLDESTQKRLGIDKESDKDGSKMNAYVDTKTNEFMTNYESERKTQEIFGGGEKSINARSDANAGQKLKSVSEFESEVQTEMTNNKGMTREQAIVKSAFNIGKQNGLKESEIQQRLDVFAGEKGKIVHGKLTYSDKGNKRLLNTVKRNSRVDADEAKGKGLTIATDKQIQQHAKIKEDTMVAERLAIPKLNENTLKDAVQMGDQGAIALEKRIRHYSEARKSMARAAYMKSTLGVFGETANKVEGSAEAQKNLQYDLNATQKGEYTSEKLTGTINSDKNVLKELFTTAFKIDPKTKIKTLYKNSTSYKVIRSVMANLGLKDKELMSLSNVNAAVIGKTSMSVMGNKSRAFNASVDNITVNRLQKDGITTTLQSNSNVTDKESTQAKNKFIIDKIKTEQGGISDFEANKLYGEAKAVEEIIDGVKLGMDVLAEVLSSLSTGRNSKVTEANRKLAIELSQKAEKEKIIKSNNSRISDLNKQQKAGNRLTPTEIAEKNRLISENTSLYSEIKEHEGKFSEFKSEIKSSTKTGVDKFKDLYREKSLEEKMLKTDDAGKLKLAQNYKPTVESNGKISGGLKGLGYAGIAYTAYEGVKEGNQRIQMNDKGGAAIVGAKTATIIGAGLVGGEAGASIGATMGATIGTFIFPVAGTAVGGAVGGFIGGVGGGAIGAIGAAHIGDSVLNMYDHREVKEIK